MLCGKSISGEENEKPNLKTKVQFSSKPHELPECVDKHPHLSVTPADAQIAMHGSIMVYLKMCVSPSLLCSLTNLLQEPLTLTLNYLPLLIFRENQHGRERSRQFPVI